MFYLHSIMLLDQFKLFYWLISISKMTDFLMCLLNGKYFIGKRHFIPHGHVEQIQLNKVRHISKFPKKIHLQLVCHFNSDYVSCRTSLYIYVQNAPFFLIIIAGLCVLKTSKQL
jgi:hypothetical protein